MQKRVAAVALFAAVASWHDARAAETGQQVYDRAQAAADAGDWNKAILGFREALGKITPGTRVGGIIRARLAEALLMSRKVSEARAAATEAVAALAAKSSAPDAELASAYLTLGDAARYDLDLNGAVEAYRQAQAVAPANSVSVRSSAMLGTVLSAATTDPELAARTADALIADPAIFAAFDKDTQASILGVRARIELNRGAPKAALPFLRRALALHGPLTRKVSIQDVGLRADAALVYQMLGDDENTKKYLAYTGAGHLPSNDWMSGAKDLPVCGGDIRPEDTAIVEFGIMADGSTSGAVPIYVSRPGEVGIVFAEAVRSWRWNREAVGKLDPFWRSAMRMQLRCATTPPATALSEPFADAGVAWLKTLVTSAEDEDGDPDFRSPDGPADLKLLSAAIDRAQEAGDAKAWVVRFKEADSILVRMGAPVDVRAYVAGLATSPQKAASVKQSAAKRSWRLAAAIPMVDAMPGSARAAAWLRVELGMALEAVGRFADARPLLDVVQQLPTTVLAADDPIRKVAILHQSLLDRVAGNHQAAEARLKEAGVTAAECALFDVQPVPTNVSIASSQFPTEALRWGFEGMAREAFDIAPDGTVQNVRTVIAYPPFVFANATERAVARFRFLPPTLGGSVLGCSNQGQTVRFGIP
jgi:tetratricopeptide (TPR) repeat protein